MTVSGNCLTEAEGDGGDGGDGSPAGIEIPICRGNNGNTLLMYDSGTSYDRIGPNLFGMSFVSEMDQFRSSKSITSSRLNTIRIVSPTRMILINSSSEAGGCTYTSIIYLDFVRDDPAIRCGKIIYVSPLATPKPSTPTPEPKKVDPRIEGKYSARISVLSNACDSQAKSFAPSFQTANLSVSPENKLVLAAPSKRYELELSPLSFSFYSDKTKGEEEHLGIYTLDQPASDTFSLMMTLVRIPELQLSGNWLVNNQDGSKSCGGSIDLTPREIIAIPWHRGCLQK